MVLMFVAVSIWIECYFTACYSGLEFVLIPLFCYQSAPVLVFCGERREWYACWNDILYIAFR